MSTSKNYTFWLWLALAIILIDQMVKVWISSHFIFGQPYEVTSFFNITLLHNTGTAFSMLSQQAGWQRWFLGFISSAVSIFILITFIKKEMESHVFAAALSCILGGAIGNLIDRIHLGYVIDFIQLHYAGYSFAVFNLADAAITLGAALLIGVLFFSSSKE